MKRLLPRQRAAVALGVAFMIGTMGAAFAGPEISPGGNPSVTLDVSPNDGDNLPSPAAITVTGAGFGAFSAGDISQCTFDPVAQADFCSQSPLARFAANANGGFTQTVNVSSSFTALNSNNQPVTVNCLVVQCFVFANQDASGNNAQHHISFSGGSGTTSTSTSTSTSTTTSTSTSTSTTVPTTTTSSTTTTVAPTTTTSSTTTTVAPTTTTPSTTTTVAPTTTTSGGGGTTTTLSASQCAQLQQARTAFNAQIDATIAAVNASSLTASQKAAVIAQLQAVRTQGNSQIDAALARAGCSVAT